MNKKYVPFMCVSALAAIAWLFLPFVSYYGISFSLFEAIDELGLGEGFGTICMIAAIVGGVIGVIASFIQKKGLAVTGAWIGTLGVVGTLVSFMSEGAEIGELFEMLGMGVWIALVAYVVSIVLASKISKAEAPQQNQPQNPWPQG